MARLAGVEPATLGLEGRCSIQMSYRRMILKLYAAAQANYSNQKGVILTPSSKFGRGREIIPPAGPPIGVQISLTLTSRISDKSKYPQSLFGRGREIRTPDILLPKQARYQTALYPDTVRQFP